MAQTSPVVHALPSSHSAALGACWQPAAGSQLSLVQTLASLQLGAAPPTHLPETHESPVVHALPSSHASALSANTHPSAGSQLSVVHGLLSLHVTAFGPVQTLPVQMSFVVHALPSEHTDVFGTFTQPVALLQLSSVQTLLSLQDLSVPAQAPPWQVSPVVHGLASSHAAVLLACKQPCTLLQVSVVHTLASSQETAVGGVPQTPAVQVAPPCHALPTQVVAMHVAPSPSAVWTHPPVESQESTVHALPSSHLLPVPPHLPLAQTSLVVHALPSLQPKEFAVLTQPVSGLQLSSVQLLLSLQLAAVPGWQLPPAQK